MAEIIEINGLSAPGLEVFTRLTEAQLRRSLEPELGIFIAEGEKVTGHALDAGCEPLSLLVERKHIAGKARELIERCGVPVYTGERDVLAGLTGFELTRGVLCALRRPAPRDVPEVCAGAHRIAVLENVTDPTNIGAIFRSAAALGMDAVLLSPDCCDPLHRRAVRVSMGTVFQVPWAAAVPEAAQWPGEGLAALKGLGFTTAAMALSARALDIDDARLAAEDRLAIVLGAEGDGLAGKTIARCDCELRIPMSHGVDSLNVAAASAVAFWQLRYRRAD